MNRFSPQQTADAVPQTSSHSMPAGTSRLVRVLGTLLEHTGLLNTLNVGSPFGLLTLADAAYEFECGRVYAEPLKHATTAPCNIQ